MSISKLQAAQQQLDCAIRLLFNEDDMPSVITLSRAAFRVLYDIFPVANPDGEFRGRLERLIKILGWHAFNRIANELKLAEKDAEAMMDPHVVHAISGIGFAITLYHQITDSYTPEMRAFESVMAMLDPEVSAGPPDPTAEGYADFMRASQYYEAAGHDRLMSLGREALQFFKSVPEGGNYVYHPQS